MPTVHFLNVRQGDCSIIQHTSGRVTVIDVNNAERVADEKVDEQALASRVARAVMAKFAADSGGNFHQKDFPENPIVYMKERTIDSIFRFVLTHPDMDHMDGIKDLFDKFSPANFWDTDNACDKDSDDWGDGCPYDQADWDFYKSLRKSESDPKRLVYHSGETRRDFWKQDGLHVLAPTPELVAAADEKEDWNDCSYVLLHKADHKTDGKPSWKTIFAGDSHDETWEHVLDEHEDKVTDIDLLIAPHHGRHSDRDFGFLDVLKPKLTLFGNAPSEHLAYDAWSSRDLKYITNNQAGSVIVDLSSDYGSVFGTNEAWARKRLPSTWYSKEYKAWLATFIR